MMSPQLRWSYTGIKYRVFYKIREFKQILKLSNIAISSPTDKETLSKRSIEKILENNKYTGTVTLLDSATQEYESQMKEYNSPIITESEFWAVQKEKKNRSNIVNDDDGTYHSSKQYSSKKKNK